MAQGHKFTVLFDTGSSEDLISPQLANKLQCLFTPVQLDVDGFIPGICTQITQQAENVQFQIQHVSFEQKFLVSRLVGCDLLLGNPWMGFHLLIIDTRTEHSSSPKESLLLRPLLVIDDYQVSH